jgi:hypothetical protein
MADTNEAQLLSDLLREIAREDARVDAAHLEARVMEAVEASTPVRRKSVRHWRTSALLIAATVAVAVVVPAMFWLKVEAPGEKVHLKVDATEEVVEQTNARGPARADGSAKTNGPAEANGPASRLRQGYGAQETGRYVPQIANSTVIESVPIVAQSPVAQSSIAPITQSYITQSLDEFVPLMPMTERELTGPFQLVRVQMPRASLGALRSPLEHPNELVEADVLLGEDGMARAIRVSASGSVYPWRSR